MKVIATKYLNTNQMNENNYNISGNYTNVLVNVYT